MPLRRPEQGSHLSPFPQGPIPSLSISLPPSQEGPWPMGALFPSSAGLGVPAELSPWGSKVPPFFLPWRIPLALCSVFWWKLLKAQNQNLTSWSLWTSQSLTGTTPEGQWLLLCPCLGSLTARAHVWRERWGRVRQETATRGENSLKADAGQ